MLDKEIEYGDSKNEGVGFQDLGQTVCEMQVVNSKDNG